jgi:hypothetical protein
MDGLLLLWPMDILTKKVKLKPVHVRNKVWSLCQGPQE